MRWIVTSKASRRISFIWILLKQGSFASKFMVSIPQNQSIYTHQKSTSLNHSLNDCVE